MLNKKELHEMMSEKFGKNWQSKVARLMAEITGCSYKNASNCVSRIACGTTRCTKWCELAMRLVVKKK